MLRPQNVLAVLTVAFVLLGCGAKGDLADRGEGGSDTADRDAGSTGGFDGFPSPNGDGAVKHARADAALPAHDGSGTLTSLRIEPLDVVLTVKAGTAATQDYKVFGHFEGMKGETEITDRSVFYISDNVRLGAFANDLLKRRRRFPDLDIM